jgi:hypothetical protein
MLNYLQMTVIPMRTNQFDNIRLECISHEKVVKLHLDRSLIGYDRKQTMDIIDTNNGNTITLTAHEMTELERILRTRY